jgi:hypothetical protein
MVKWDFTPVVGRDNRENQTCLMMAAFHEKTQFEMIEHPLVSLFLHYKCKMCMPWILVDTMIGMFWLAVCLVVNFEWVSGMEQLVNTMVWNVAVFCYIYSLTTEIVVTLHSPHSYVLWDVYTINRWSQLIVCPSVIALSLMGYRPNTIFGAAYLVAVCACSAVLLLALTQRLKLLVVRFFDLAICSRGGYYDRLLHCILLIKCLYIIQGFNLAIFVFVFANIKLVLELYKVACIYYSGSNVTVRQWKQLHAIESFLFSSVVKSCFNKLGWGNYLSNTLAIDTNGCNPLSALPLHIQIAIKKCKKIQ